jgi:hypothetical protein
MPAVAPIIAVVSVVASVAGTAFSIMQQRKASKAQKRSNQEQQRQAALRARRERRQAIREQQIKRAAVVNFAEGQGIGGSSAPSAATGSLSSQTGTIFGKSSFIGASNARINFFNQKAQDHLSRAQLGGSIAGLGQQLFSAAGGFGSISDFGGSPTAKASGDSSAIVGG